MSDTNVTPHDILINGHTVSLFSQDDTRFPVDAANTDWLLVKFDQFITYPILGRLRQEHSLEIHERVSDDNVYLCKYEPKDLNPVINDDVATHVALYPNHAVPVPHLLSGTSQQGETVPLVVALHPNPSQTPQQVLDELSRRFGAERIGPEVTPDANFVRVRLARDKLQAAANIDSVRTIEEDVPNEFGSILATETLGPVTISTIGAGTGAKKFNCTGEGETVYVADSGFDKGNKDDVHPAFSGRVEAVYQYPSTLSMADTLGHGTHVAGSVLGNLGGGGNNMIGMSGTAPGAGLVAIAIDPPNVPSDLFSLRTPGVYAPTIHTNSWGKPPPKLADGTVRQLDYGLSDAYKVDEAMFGDRELCVVFIAENYGEFLSSGYQQQIGAWASAKNNIVVGSCYSTRPEAAGTNGYNSTGAVHSVKEMSTFSSRGPTLAGRIGVDVVAPGEVILSARSRTISPDNLANNLQNYGKPLSDDLLFMSGTSMAAPAVAGCVACLRQAYRRTYGDHVAPSGAMLKALIIHGAVDLVDTVFTNKVGGVSTQLTMTKAPNTFQGYGLVNMANSIAPLVNSPEGPNGTEDGQTDTGEEDIRTFTVPQGSQCLTVTMAYSDSPGMKLQNVIELKVSRQGVDLPILQPTDPLQRLKPKDFKQENVAKVVVPNPPAGEYSIKVDVLTSMGRAKWAVVWSLS